MDGLFKKQIEEAVDVGESIANVYALARAIGVPDDDPVLLEVIQELQETPYVVICFDIWGRNKFDATRAPTLDLAIKEAKRLTQISQSFDAFDDGAPNIYRYIVHGPGISEEGIRVTA